MSLTRLEGYSGGTWGEHHRPDSVSVSRDLHWFEQLARDTSRLTEADRVRRPGVGNLLGFARNFTTVPQADVEDEPTPLGERKIGELKKHLEESD